MESYKNREDCIKAVKEGTADIFPMTELDCDHQTELVSGNIFECALCHKLYEKIPLNNEENDELFVEIRKS